VRVPRHVPLMTWQQQALPQGAPGPSRPTRRCRPSASAPSPAPGRSRRRPDRSASAAACEAGHGHALATARHPAIGSKRPIPIAERLGPGGFLLRRLSYASQRPKLFTKAARPLRKAARRRAHPTWASRCLRAPFLRKLSAPAGHLDKSDFVWTNGPTAEPGLWLS
jgi:hypothetical protein